MMLTIICVDAHGCMAYYPIANTSTDLSVTTPSLGGTKSLGTKLRHSQPHIKKFHMPAQN